MSFNPYAGKRLLLVGTGGVKRLHVMQALRALGLAEIICLNDTTNWAAPLVDRWIEADPVRPSAATLARLKREARGIDGVLTWDDYSVELAATIASELGFVGIAPEAAAAAKNKAEFRRVCTERGLPAPRFIHVDPGSPSEALEDLRFPVVVKPTHGGGSVLVRRADDTAQLVSVLAAHVAALETEPAAALWPDHRVLIEEYIAGAEVDIDLVLQGGQLRYAAVTDNFPPVEPWFMELGGQLPSLLPEPAQIQLVEMARQVLAALGVREGCIHFEARWTPNGPMPIEANLRLGGAEVFEFNRLACGVNLVEQAVRVALGLPVPAFGVNPIERCVKSLNFIPPHSGLLGSIRVDPGLETDGGFGELVLFRAPGDAIRIPPDGFDYLGWLVSQGSTPTKASAALDALCRRIHFEVGGTAFDLAPVGTSR